MMRIIWEFDWKEGHYVEWSDENRTHLAFMSDEEYQDLLFDIELS